MAVMRCDFVQLYGATEHSGCLTHLAPEDHDPEHRPGLLRSCGRPLPWVELAVIDPDTLRHVPADTVGEVVARSTQVMAGYWASRRRHAPRSHLTAGFAPAMPATWTPTAICTCTIESRT